MIISQAEWIKYINKLSKISSAAGDMMKLWVEVNGLDDRNALIDYAHAVITKYGEGSAELSCQMYDAIAEMEGKYVEAAIPADIPTISETAKAINGALKQSPTGQLVESVVQRLVKRTGADTTLNNAIRDKAQFAWIPHGDTCAFCITLASRGWQNASKKALKDGHAEHIHSHCDCQYAIRFDSKTQIEGYDPQVYQDMYYSHEGKPQEKINAMRRENYSKHKEEINYNKRLNYEQRKPQLNLQFFAQVPQDKLTNYFLNPEHPTGKNKAIVFEKVLGYNRENYKDLQKAILDNFDRNKLEYKRKDEYGVRYEQIMEIMGANGRKANVVTAWIKENDSDEERLVSAYVEGT